MAFSVKQVKAKLQEYGVPAEQLDTAAEYFCAAHKTDLDAIKEERDALKTDVETLTAAKKELDGLKAEMAKNDGKDPYESKYNDLKAEYDKYKTDVEAKEAKAKKVAAFRALAKEAGVGDKRLDTVVKGSDINGVIDAIELDKDGNIKGKDKLIEGVKAEWADFITTTTTTGAQTANPPANNGGGLKTLDEIYKTDEHGRFVYDATQRQQARAELLAAQQQKG